ncbi:hypothetical protein VTO42DRAFT_4460 [Malbranchea cinnamomea]
MAKYISCLKDVDMPELANLFFDNVFSQYSFPTDITSDRRPVFTSNYWSQLCYHLHIKRNLSTAYHLQTDSQMEKLTKRYEKSVEHMAKFYDQKRKPLTFAPRDEVLLSTKNLCSMHPSKKLDNRWYGPFEIEETVGTYVYRLQLLSGWKIHPVFHVFQLEPFYCREGEELEQPPSVVIDGHEEWEIKEILDERTEKDLANTQALLKAYRKNHKAADNKAVGQSGQRPQEVY